MARRAAMGREGWVWLSVGVAVAGGFLVGRVLAGYLDPLTVVRWLQ